MIHKILQQLIWLIIKTLTNTYRYEVRGREHFEKAKTLNPKGSFIFVMWHEQVIATMKGHANTEPYLALASRSKDGDYAAYVSKKMGFVSVRGSSNKRNKDKGGKEALSEYIMNLNKGISGGLTVDGPKGPRNKCKPGAIIMSMQTGAPILPAACVANRYWEFNSWDKFKIPKPFAKIIMTYGEPIVTESGFSPEKVDEVCEQVNQSLNRLTAAALI